MGLFEILGDPSLLYVKRSKMIILLIFGLLMTIHIASATIYVPDDYTKIQWAIYNASAGETIVVRDGVYEEGSIVINKSLSVTSENGSASTLIVGSFQIKSSDVTIKGFAIDGQGRGYCIRAIQYGLNNIKISNNKIFNCSSGIVISGGSTYDFWRITNIKISGNEITGNYFGMVIGGVKFVQIENNNISYNFHTGLEIEQGKNVTISDNIIRNNSIGGATYYKGIKIIYSDGINILNNVIENHTRGIVLSETKYVNMYNNTINNNKYNLYLDDIELETFEMQSNYVDGKPVFFLKNSRPEFQQVYTGNYGMILIVNSSNVKIVGATCTNNSHGAWISSSNNIVLSNGKFSNNDLGILIDDYSDNVRIEDCTIDNNDRCGIKAEFSTNIAIENSDIRYNKEWAAALLLTYSENSTVRNSRIVYNGNVGISVGDNTTIMNSNISYNGNGGIFGSSSKFVRIVNNTIIGNKKDVIGSGIYLQVNSHHAIIMNNTISDNEGDGIHLDESPYALIKGNEIENNKNYGIFISASHHTTVVDNTIRGVIFVGREYSSEEIPENVTISSNLIAGIYLNALNSSVFNNTIRNSDYGIRVYGSGNDIIRNKIERCSMGIKLSYSSDNNNVSFNVLNDSMIWVYRSYNSTLIGNTLNKFGIYVYGVNVDEWIHEIRDNTVNGKPIHYIKNSVDLVVLENVGQVIVANSTNITIRNLSLSNLYAAIDVGFSKNLTIENCTLTNNEYAVYAWNMDGSRIENCSVKSNSEAIKLYHSDFNAIRYNNISDNELKSIYLTYSTNNTIEENEITNNGRGYGAYRYNVYIVDSDDNVIEGNRIINNSYGIYVSYSDRTTVKNNTISLNDVGIYARNSNNNSIENNSLISNSNYGICFEGSDCGYVFNNVISGTHTGIKVWSGSEFNVIESNRIDSQEYGVYLGSNYNRILGNDISNGEYGIMVTSRENVISNNTVHENEYGIALSWGARYNVIYLNNFYNNTNNYEVSSYYLNYWNSTSPVTYHYSGTDFTSYVGNYWDDYSGEDSDGDGIGDVPYTLTSNNVDYYPLIGMWNGSAIESIIVVYFTYSPQIPWIMEIVTFNASLSRVPSNANYIWDFGDGNITISSSPVITHVYTDEGKYTVNLTITSGRITKSFSKIVNVTKRGDFFGNHEIDIADVSYVAAMVVGKIEPNMRADFNGNGRVDIGDLAKITYCMLGKVSEV